jgi:hypothetical protein
MSEHESPTYPVPIAPGADAPPPPAYPVSGPAYPVSGAAYPVPGPAWPVSGPAYPVSAPAWAPPAPPVKGRKTAWTLGIITALLVVLGGIGGAIFYTHLTGWNDTIAERQDQIGALEKKVTAQKDELTARQNAVDKAAADLHREQNKLSAARACEKGVQDLFAASLKRDVPAVNAAATQMMRYCE